LAYAGSAVAVVVALGVGSLIERFIGLQSISLVFLMAVLASAIAWGLWPSLFSCMLSVLAFNFFFIPPIYTFTIVDPENVIALFFFALVAAWSAI
jgi:two-component system sensor histidine kinase KdpD